MLRRIKYTQHKKVTTMVAINPLMAAKSKKSFDRQKSAFPKVVRISTTDPDATDSSTAGIVSLHALQLLSSSGFGNLASM